MDIATILSYVPTVIKYAGTVKEILDTAKSNADAFKTLKDQVAPVIPILEAVGGYLFPQAKKEIQQIGAAIATFDPNIVKWIQGAVNEIVKPATPLVVDGVYGPLTRDGVKQLQQALGVKIVDGVAGRITQAAIDAWFAAKAA